MYKIPMALVVIGTLMLPQQASAVARLAVGHFAPFADTIDGTAVDIAVNGSVALPNVKFKDSTDYIDLEAGVYVIDIIPVGTTEPAITATFSLEDGKDYSVYAVGNGSTQPLKLRAMSDDVAAPMSGNLNIRVVHVAPFAADLAATEVSIRTAGGDVVNGLVGVPYDVDSGFFEVPAGTYDLKVASNDGSINYIDPLPAALPAGANVTVIAIGDGINQPLGIIAYPVGELALRTPVDNRSNGLWEIVEGSGTGFTFQPMPSKNSVVGTWYTYDADGNATFFNFDSCNSEAGEACAASGAFDGVTATTALYASTGGGSSEGDVVTSVKIGEIDFEILGCNDAMATVVLDGGSPVMYTAKQLTRAFPCTD